MEMTPVRRMERDILQTAEELKKRGVDLH